MSSTLSPDEVEALRNFPAFYVPCPHCGAPPFEHCQTRAGERSHVHVARHVRLSRTLRFRRGELVFDFYKWSDDPLEHGVVRADDLTSRRLAPPVG